MTDGGACPAIGAETPRPLRAIERLVALSGAAAAVCLLGLLLLMLAELASRNLLGKSLHVSWEVGAYAMAAVVFLGAGSALQHGVHVRVTILQECLGAGWARLLDTAVSAMGLAVAGFVAAVLTRLAWNSYAQGVMSWSGFGIPLFLPQAVCAFGAIMFAMQIAARLARCLLGLPPDPFASSDLLEGEA